ncbi:ATP-binding protein [Glaciecola sp. SC05]|uniref:sensor histidine kinase n=1 Tax=Glaciecola sp. SC05 TaxID=1987355 RepID=UPI003526D17C
MPRHEREQYLGKPLINEDDLTFALSDHLGENLTDICDLVMEVFNAQRCAVIADYDDQCVSLHNLGDIPEQISRNALAILNTSKFTAIESFQTPEHIDEPQHQVQVIAVPLILLDGLKFGAVVFTREIGEALANKELRILSVIARDVQNFFIHRRETFEAEKSFELQKLMLQNNKDWIFVKDAEFRIVYANNAFLQVYPESMRDKVIGYTTIEEYDDEASEKFLTFDRMAFEKGISETTEDLHMPDGSHIIVASTKRRFEDKNGESYILCVCRDITEQHKLIINLQKANQELDDFTSIASHDLKSPLNAIRRLLVWIEEETEGTLPENAKENLRFAVNRAERMHTLLNDLLKFAKIGREEVKNTRLSLQKSVDELRPLLDIPEHFELNADELMMYVPSVPFNTILLNLISNAFKHNDKEHPKVRVEASTSKHYYIIKVQDNGPGISPQFHERVFKLFQTLKPRDEVEGSGMGLSVVKKYVEYYQGRIEISSDGESGCCFTIYWPIVKHTQKAATHTKAKT